MNVTRRDKNNYYLDIAQTVAERGTCLRRNYGAIIVSNDEIVATGYTGAPRGCTNCIDTGVCKRNEYNIPSGQRYELCRSVHAEANAIISASRREMIGASLYLVGIDAVTGGINPKTESCHMCKRMIINSGITKVFARIAEDRYIESDVSDWINDIDMIMPNP